LARKRNWDKNTFLASVATIAEYRRLRGWLTDLALQTNKALALAEQLIESLRSHRVIVPTVTMIDTGNRKIAYLE